MDPEERKRIDLEALLGSGYFDLEEVLDALEYEVSTQDGIFRKQGLELRDCPPEKRKLAIAISGGGAAGAYSAGLLEVLLERLKSRGIDVGLLVGTSSGAVNGYGVFVQALGMGNPQFDNEPSIQQPYGSYIASVWSYLARGDKASRWLVGRRSWVVSLVSRGLPAAWRRLGWALLVVLAVLLQPNLLLPLAAAAARAGFIPSDWMQSGSLAGAVPYLFASAAATTCVLGLGVWLVARAFRESLFRDIPLLRFLANTGPNGDLRRYVPMSRVQAVDRARVLGRELVSEWYEQRDSAPEFVATATDITAGRECLFTLVRPDTYARLCEHGWMAVQFDSDASVAQEYRTQPNAVFALSQDYLRALAASSAVPGAFPTQRIGIYGPDSRQPARHHFVDGGVLNNSPIHIAIDAGATHVISLEIRPFSMDPPLEDDPRSSGGYNLLQAGLATFTTVLERATEDDMRRTAAWNRFLIARPSSLEPVKDKGWQKLRAGDNDRRVVPIYRVAPREPLVGTVDFDGAFAGGRRTTTLRELLRRGVLDMQGRNLWNATTQHEPSPEEAR